MWKDFKFFKKEEEEEKLAYAFYVMDFHRKDLLHDSVLILTQRYCVRVYGIDLLQNDFPHNCCADLTAQCSVRHLRHASASERPHTRYCVDSHILQWWRTPFTPGISIGKHTHTPLLIFTQHNAGVCIYATNLLRKVLLHDPVLILIGLSVLPQVA